MAVDPVCGMTVNPDRAAGTVDHDGTTYYFCSKSCVAKFEADPKKYLAGAREPMHAPQVITLGGLKKGTASSPPSLACDGRSFGEAGSAASPEPRAPVRSPQSPVPSPH